MSDGFDDLTLFCRLIEAGGVSAAALALGSSPAAVSRRLARLEARLGTRLAERNARRFRPTEEGLLYYRRAVVLLEALRDAEAEVSAKTDRATGRLRIGAPVELGRRLIAGLVSDFAARHPRIEAHLTLSDAGLEASQDGLDIALRFGLPMEQTLIARKIAAVPRVVCAAPDYLARRGTPLRPEDLADHECLRLTRRRGTSGRWSFARDGLRQEVEVSGRLASSSGEVVHLWALGGHGLSSEALWDVQADFDAGRLVEVLADYRGDPIELFATFLPGRPLPPKIRLFVDHVAAAFLPPGN